MSSYWRNIFTRSGAEPDVLALLEQVPVFEMLSRRELRQIEEHLYRRRYATGDPIFRQGEPGLGMYIIEQGTVEIVVEPAWAVLATLQAGDFFGEIALLNEIPRSATARAATPCRIAGLFQPDLLGLLERKPRLGIKLLHALARITGRRLVEANAELIQLRTGGDGHRPTPLQAPARSTPPRPMAENPHVE